MLLDNDTVAPVVFDTVTVQAEVTPDKMLLGAHDNRFTTVGAVRAMLTV